jgi:hypothetical protein
MRSNMLSVNGSTGRSGLTNNWFEKTLIDLFGCFYVAPIGGRHQISVNQERWSDVRWRDIDPRRVEQGVLCPLYRPQMCPSEGKGCRRYRGREDQVFDILKLLADPDRLVPASIATRADGRSVNHFSMALGVVLKRPRSTTSPPSLSVQ